MIAHHDITRSSSARSEEPRGSDFLGVLTFIKPNFRIAVAPRTGELSVQVQLESSSAEAARPVPATRH